jgi:hypothetical protein
LYLGAIPIVQRSAHMQTFSELPILYTDDYSEITQSYLEAVYEDFASRTFDFSRLYAPFYTNMLLDAVNRLDDPAFLLLLSDERSSKECAEGKLGFWPARAFLDRLSRYDSPHQADLQTGNLIPLENQYHGRWQAMNGAEITFDSAGNLIVEHAFSSDQVGAFLPLPAVKHVTYRVSGEIRNLADTSYPPQLEVFSPQTKSRMTRLAVDGETGAADPATKVDLIFTSGKSGTYLQFRPGRRAMLNLRVEPLVD